MKNIKFKKNLDIGDRVQILSGNDVDWCDAKCHEGEKGEVIKIYTEAVSRTFSYKKSYEKRFLTEMPNEQIVKLELENGYGWNIPEICVEII